MGVQRLAVIGGGAESVSEGVPASVCHIQNIASARENGIQRHTTANTYICEGETPRPLHIVTATRLPGRRAMPGGCLGLA